MAWARSIGGAVFGVWVFLGAVVSGLVFGTLGVLPCVVLPRHLRARTAIYAAAAWARFVVHGLLWCRLTRTGEVALGPDEGALVLCNHRSWLDPLLLLAYTRANGLSKREILWLPVIGLYGWIAGTVFFDRRDKRARQQARDDVMYLVKHGARVQVFPEGTRSRDGRIGQRVYLNLAMDCWHAGIPVIPCAVRHTERAVPVRRWGAFPRSAVSLDVLPALRPADYPSARAYAHAAWTAVVAQAELP
jgi:1-acyl-sn-glycerol-3-phosphate acyltransferase